jgi:hypothetical protein
VALSPRSTSACFRESEKADVILAIVDSGPTD